MLVTGFWIVTSFEIERELGIDPRLLVATINLRLRNGGYNLSISEKSISVINDLK